ncbi:MAG: hypothetical protein H0W89_04810 [Candidatus Levybacteria bacterium]|nr:hypothetical protein [Candidatus Levybacteria bacterium]
MISLTNPHPLSLVLYKKRNFFSNRLYLKESYFRRREETYMKRLLGASGVILIVAGLTMLGSYSQVLTR